MAEEEHEARPRLLNSEEFLELGCRLMGTTFYQSRRKAQTARRKLSKFVAHYGVHPHALAQIWIDLQLNPIIADRLPPKYSAEHVLVVYRWMKGYASELDLHNQTGFPEQSIREFCRVITLSIANLRKTKVCTEELVEKSMLTNGCSLRYRLIPTGKMMKIRMATKSGAIALLMVSTTVSQSHGHSPRNTKATKWGIRRFLMSSA